jgi:hypothetical protein
LVAATVPDLAIDQVAVLNERGQLLTPEFSDVPSASSSASAIENNYTQRVERIVASVAPRAHIQVKVAVVPRAGEADGVANSSMAGARDHQVRVILFERSPLSALEEQLIRKAVMTELSLDTSGSELLFSPAPEIAAAAPSQSAPTSLAERGQSAREAQQGQFMADLTRSWTLALSALAAIVLGFIVLRARRGSQYRRQELATRIRQQLLLVDGTANAV